MKTMIYVVALNLALPLALAAEAPPPAASTAQAAADKTAHDVMLGEWQTEITAGNGDVYDAWVIYKADGSYAGTLQIKSASGDTSSPMAGTWEVHGINDTRFNLVAYETGSLPMTTTLDIIDTDKLFDRAQNVYSQRVVRAPGQ